MLEPRAFNLEQQGREMGGESLVPVASTEKDQGFQVTVIIPPDIENHLSLEAEASLTQTGQSFLHEVLLEARRLAAHDSNDLGFTITPKHISQAELVERRRHQAKRDKWELLQSLGWAGIGAAIGTVSSNLQLAFGLLRCPPLVCAREKLAHYPDRPTPADEE